MPDISPKTFSNASTRPNGRWEEAYNLIARRIALIVRIKRLLLIDRPCRRLLRLRMSTRLVGFP